MTVAARLLHAPESASIEPPTITTRASSAFPGPPPGAVVFARQHGSEAVALAVTPGRRLRLQISVLGPDGTGVAGLRPSVRIDRSPVIRAGACGRGRYCVVVRGIPRPARVLVALRGSTIAFALPRAWPPPPADALVARAGRVWRRLRTLTSHERLASSPTSVVNTTWRFAAPDRLSYCSVGGGAGIVIGGRRWDKVPGRPWQASSQEPRLRQPTPLWSGVTDARVLGTVSIRGRPAWRVSFFDPRTPAWFTAAIDRSTLRTLDLRMVATAHFMHERYSRFNAPERLRPPVR